MRIIAKLDIKPPYVVKPIHFEGLRIVGQAEGLVNQYYKDGADEIIYIDIVASLYSREILYKEIQQTTSNIFVPFAVGGGIRSLDDISKLFRHGADKVILNTHVLQNNPDLIDQAAKVYGSQSVVLNIEAQRFADEWICFSDCGRVPSNKKVLPWVKEAENRGVGEIILQSIDCDGVKCGFDIELIRRVVDGVNIPVVACSGAGSLRDIEQVANQAQPSGIAVASLLHYKEVTINDIKALFNREKIDRRRALIN